MIPIHCPACGLEHNMPEDYLGQQVICQGCAHEFTASEPSTKFPRLIPLIRKDSPCLTTESSQKKPYLLLKPIFPLMISALIASFSLVLIFRADSIREEIKYTESSIHKTCDRAEASIKKSRDATPTSLYIFGDKHRHEATALLAEAGILSQQLNTLQEKPLISTTCTRLLWTVFTISSAYTAFLLLPRSIKMALHG